MIDNQLVITFICCFNPAEAEEGFKRKEQVEEEQFKERFNPAEAEEGFKRRTVLKRYQSSVYDKTRPRVKHITRFIHLAYQRTFIETVQM